MGRNAESTEAPRRLVTASVLILLMGLIGMLGILTFAGITILPTAPFDLAIKVPVLHRSAHGAVVSAAVTWMGGTLALLTFLWNLEQKERLAMLQERRERDLAELQRLEAEFASLLSNLISPSSHAKINAIIGLGEIAKKSDPNRIGADGKLLPLDTIYETIEDENGHRVIEVMPSIYRSSKSPENFPFFVRAFSRLAASIGHSQDHRVTSQIVFVLKELAEWAADHEIKLTDESLLINALNICAESNRSYWHYLQQRAAHCRSLGLWTDNLLQPWRVWRRLGGGSEEEATAIAQALKHDIFEKIESVDSEFSPEIEDNSVAVQSFVAAVRSFLAISEVLAHCIRKIGRPVRGAVFENSFVDWDLTRKARKIDLRNIRLYGERISGSNLQAVDLSGAVFVKTSCLSVKLDGATMRRASFSHCELHNASFRGARAGYLKMNSCQLIGSRFDGAHLLLAHFSDSRLQSSSFIEATCNHVRFAASDLSVAKFHGAKCYGARFSGAVMEGTFLGGARMGQGERNREPFFDGLAWLDANFNLFIYGQGMDPLETCNLDFELIEFLTSISSESRGVGEGPDEF